ncbi:MAG: Gfo/Idh/MocA family oxidoreductase, partial [Dermabacter sp.]|nr:Gfo/Idh/MocA family oxidoreductase [Dermabacter sp.]
PAEAPTWGGLKLHVAGTGGQLEIDAFSQRVDGPGQWHPFGFNLDALLLDAFLEAVRSGETQEPSGAVGARTVRVVDAAQESVRTGRPVPLR